MNRPIRRLSIACLVLLLSLLIADNLIQLVEAQSLRNKPQNSRQRQIELARPRGPIVVDGKAVAESVPSKDVYKYQREYPGGSLYAPVTGYFSIVSATQVEQSENGVLSGTDSRLFVRRLSDYFTGRQPKGGAVVLTLDAATQQAAATPRSAGRKGAVVALDPKTGRDPRARHLAVVRPQPARGARRHHAEHQRPPAFHRPEPSRCSTAAPS